MVSPVSKHKQGGDGEDWKNTLDRASGKPSGEEGLSDEVRLEQRISPSGDTLAWGSSFQVAGTTDAQAPRSKLASVFRGQREPVSPGE